jgi:hypothetical protein
MDRLRQMAEAPRWLWLFAAIAVLETPVFVLASDSNVPDHTAPFLFLLAVPLVLAWFLLRGSRVVWSLFVLFHLAEIPLAFTEGRPWWSLAQSAITFCLLLAPSSFEYVWKRPIPFRRMRPKT